MAGTARLTVDPGDACPEGDSTGVATFRATCDPCGEPEPEDEGLEIVNPITAPRVTPRLHANGLIAFVRGNRGGSRIMTVNARGGGARNVLNANGTGRRRVTNDQAYATAPTWSPDGSTLAVMYDNGILLIEGAKTRMLVRNASFPAWSPDGKRIAYLDLGRCVLATVGVDGKGRKTIARPKVGDGMGEPAWSPDGRSIAFNRGYLPHPYQELTVVGANGGGSRRLTSNFDDDMQASWGAR